MDPRSIPCLQLTLPREIFEKVVNDLDPIDIFNFSLISKACTGKMRDVRIKTERLQFEQDQVSYRSKVNRAQKKRKVSVETLELKLSNGTLGDVMGILKHLKPITLRTIQLDMGTGSELCLKRIAELEQWKRAKILKTQGFSMDSMPITTWKLFEGTAVRLGNLDLRLFEAMKAHYRAQANMLYAWIWHNKDEQTIAEYCTQGLVEQDEEEENFAPTKTIIVVKPGNLLFQQKN